MTESEQLKNRGIRRAKEHYSLAAVRPFGRATRSHSTFSTLPLCPPPLTLGNARTEAELAPCDDPMPAVKAALQLGPNAAIW